MKDLKELRSDSESWNERHSALTIESKTSESRIIELIKFFSNQGHMKILIILNKIELDKLVLQDLQISNVHLRLIKCRIKQIFKVSGTAINQIEIIKKSNVEHILIENICSIHNLSIIKSNILKGVLINGPEKAMIDSTHDHYALRINSLIIKKSHIYSMEREYTSAGWSIAIRNLCEIKKIELRNTSLCSFQLYNCKIINLRIVKTSFTKEFNVKGNPPERSESTFENHSLVIDKSYVSNARLKFRYINRIWLDSSKLEKFEIYKSYNIGGILITKTSHSKLDLLIKKSRIRVLDFIQFINKGKLTLLECSKNPISPSPELILDKSYLGHALMINCDFGKDWRIYYRDTRFEETTLLRTQFPKDLNNFKRFSPSIQKQENGIQFKNQNDSHRSNSSDKASKNIESWVIRRDLMIQISQLFTSAKDHPNALRYKAHSLELLKKIYRKKKLSNNEIGDWLSLEANSWTNYFGDDALKASKVVLILGILAFSTYLWFLGFRFDFSDAGIHTLGTIASYSVLFMNPLHESDFLIKDFGIDLTTSGRFFDGLYRIINSYFIYQFIQAFRKLGAKSS